MEWNGIGIKVDKSLKDGEWHLKTENLKSTRPYGTSVELVEHCGWHDPKYWRNCIMCVVREKSPLKD